MKKQIIVVGIISVLLVAGLSGCQNNIIKKSGSTDTDGDGLSDVIEKQLGSDPNNKSDVTSINIEGTTHYLVDTNKDGKSDVFYNSISETVTSIYVTEDGKYRIDLNGDGEWDYIYNPLTKAIAPYTPPNEFCSFPFCDLTPKVYDLIGSNEPSDYLGDRIAYESYSNWKNYTPLAQKVEEIIAGKDTEYDKFTAIARYVKNCREHGFPSPANEFKSVIDIYESSSGVCLDASILCTAMLRIAGIPARSMTGIIFHEFNEVFMNGTWITFDATFGDGEPRIIGFLSSIYSTGQVYNYSGTYYNVTHYKKGFYTEVDLYRQMFCGNDLLKSEYGEGILIYPVVSSSPIYCNSNLMNASQGTATLILSLDKQGEYQDETWFLNSAFEVKDNDIISEFASPGFSYIGYRGSNASGVDFARHIGYYKALVPALKYRLYYQTQILGHDIAYADFEVKDGQTTIITPDDFIKNPGENQNNFEVFMTLINELPSYESLQ